VTQITGKPKLAAQLPQNGAYFQQKTHYFPPIARIPPTIALVSSHLQRTSTAQTPHPRRIPSFTKNRQPAEPPDSLTLPTC
jgi:hypothetical protein